MRKILLIGLVAVVVGVVGAAFWLSRNASHLVSAYKPQIESAAGTALGTPVSFGDISVSVFPSTKLSVSNTVIGRTETSKGIELKSLDLALRLSSLIRGVIDISALELHSPRITFVKKGGTTSIEGLPTSRPAGSDNTTSVQSAGGAERGASSSKAPLALSLERFLLDDGFLSIRDLDSKTEQTIQKIRLESAVRVDASTIILPSLDLSAILPKGIPVSATMKDLSFGLQSGDLKADLSVSILKNIIQVLPAFNSKTLAGSAAVTSPGIDLATLGPVFKEFAPALASLNFVGRVIPNLKGNFDLKKTPPAFGANGSVGLQGIGLTTQGIVVADGKGTLDLSADPGRSALRSQKLLLSVNKEPLEISVASAINQRSNQLSVDSLTVVGFGGVTKASSQLALNAPQTFTTSIDAQNLAVGKLLALLPGDGLKAISGSIPTLKASLRGTLGDTLPNSLTGTTSCIVKDGALVGTNIIGTVVKQISSLPMVPSGAIAGLDPKTKAALESKDTTVQSLSGDFTIAAGRMSTSNLSLISSYFTLAGTGTVGFDGTLDLATTIYLTPDISAALVRNAKGLSKALDSKQQLVLPLRLNGKAPNIKVIPNTEKLLGMAAEKALESGLKNLLKQDSGVGKKKGLGGFLKGL